MLEIETPRTRYEVATHEHGRKLITSNCPAQGLLEWPQHKWARTNARPLGLKSAKAIADAQPIHATVQVWMTAEKVYDNGKAPGIPSGWYPPQAQLAAPAALGAA